MLHLVVDNTDVIQASGDQQVHELYRLSIWKIKELELLDHWENLIID